MNKGETASKDGKNPSLLESAKGAVLWGGGATVVRDVMQFGTMLILVRLLTPEDYGRVALAQSIIGVISVFSFGTFITHALQVRDPNRIDWQSHFTAGLFINAILFFSILLIAWGLYQTDQYAAAALPLMGMATLLLVEIFGSLRHRMLESRHEWKRFRLLTIYGSLLGNLAGILVALAGGGYWALVVQVPLFGVPAAIDLILKERWFPRWEFSWNSYREAFHFGIRRMGSGLSARGRQAVEQSVLAGTYSFADLGVFTRTIGLGTLIVGRLGSIVMMMLYPVITRVEAGSHRFREIARKVFGVVALVTVPLAFFLAGNAEGVVDLLYGNQWRAVAGLLPLGVASVAISGLTGVANSLLLANEQIRQCFWLDLLAAISAVVLVFWLIPMGLKAYLLGLVVHGAIFLILTIAVLARTRGIATASIAGYLVKVLFAGMLASLLAGWLPLPGFSPSTDLLLKAIAFFGLVLIALRVLVPRLLRETLLAVPRGGVVAGWFRL